MARGRKPGFKMTEEHRAKIQNSNILNALIEHIEGAREMSSTQVTAGIALLRKVLPDLSSSDNTTDVTHRYVARIPEPIDTMEEWSKKYAPQDNETTH